MPQRKQQEDSNTVVFSVSDGKGAVKDMNVYLGTNYCNIWAPKKRFLVHHMLMFFCVYVFIMVPDNI